MKRLFLFIAVVAVILVSTAVGLTLSPYLAKSLGYAPFEQATAEKEAVPVKIAEIIGAAKKSVVVASETFDSRLVLDALVAAGQRQVQVGVVLSGPANPPQSAALGWLGKKGIPVRTTQDPFKGTIIVIDQQFAAICASPIVSAQDFGAAQATLFVFHHKPTAAGYFQRIRNWKFN
jgi:hypothetical protein